MRFNHKRRRHEPARELPFQRFVSFRDVFNRGCGFIGLDRFPINGELRFRIRGDFAFSLIEVYLDFFTSGFCSGPCATIAVVEREPK